MEDWAEIRALHRRDGVSKREIARRLGISRVTVDRALASDRPPRYSRPAVATSFTAVEACRLVGVSRKTGYRWRAEMGGVIAKKRAEGTGRYLSLFERQWIASLRDRGRGIREVARRVGRSPTTVPRELARNARPWDDGYDPVTAHLRAHDRARRPKAGKIEQSPWLRSFIQERIDRRWRPEQVHLVADG